MNDTVLQQILETLDVEDNEIKLKSIFVEARDVVANQIADDLAQFRHKRTLGLGSMYGEQKLTGNTCHVHVYVYRVAARTCTVSVYLCKTVHAYLTAMYLYMYTCMFCYTTNKSYLHVHVYVAIQLIRVIYMYMYLSIHYTVYTNKLCSIYTCTCILCMLNILHLYRYYRSHD